MRMCKENAVVVFENIKPRSETAMLFHLEGSNYEKACY